MKALGVLESYYIDFAPNSKSIFFFELISNRSWNLAPISNFLFNICINHWYISHVKRYNDGAFRKKVF